MVPGLLGWDLLVCGRFASGFSRADVTIYARKTWKRSPHNANMKQMAPGVDKEAGLSADWMEIRRRGQKNILEKCHLDNRLREKTFLIRLSYCRRHQIIIREAPLNEGHFRKNLLTRKFITTRDENWWFPVKFLPSEQRMDGGWKAHAQTGRICKAVPISREP